MGNVRLGREIDSAFCKKGFRRDVDGKHVRYYFIGSNGEPSQVCTMMSHGMTGSTLSAKLISNMARQLHLTKTQFLNLVDCSLDEDAYRQFLREQDFDV